MVFNEDNKTYQVAMPVMELAKKVTGSVLTDMTCQCHSDTGGNDIHRRTAEGSSAEKR